MAVSQSLCSGDLLSFGLGSGEFLCSENRFDGLGERGVLAEGFSDGCVYRITSRRGLGVQIVYGEDVQIIHVSTGLYLQTLQVVAIERESFKLFLSKGSPLSRPGGDPSVWKIMPRFKIRSEGEGVNSSDQILLQAHLSNHFPHFLHVNLEVKEEQVNVSLQLTTWIVRVFRSHVTDVSQLLAGSVLRLHHPEHDAWLASSLEGKTSAAATHAQLLVKQWNGKALATTVLAMKESAVLEKRQTAASLWVAEHAEVTAGFAITAETNFRLRNLVSDNYLGISNEGKWEMQTKSSVTSTLLSLFPRHDAFIKLGFPAHLRAGPHWLSSNNDLELVSELQPTAANSLLVTLVSTEAIDKCSFVLARRKQLLRLRDAMKTATTTTTSTITEEKEKNININSNNKDDLVLFSSSSNNLDACCQVLSDLARFCIVSEGADLLTLRGEPLPSHQELAIETGTLMVVMEVLHLALLLIRQKHPEISNISKLVPLSYSVLRIVANANKITQRYIAHYVPLLQHHITLSEPFRGQVLEVLRSVYLDNGELIVSIPREDLVRYISYLNTSAKAPEFLSALCNVGLKGIKFTQDVFLHHLPPHFMPKLRAIKFRERADEKMLPVYIVETVVQNEQKSINSSSSGDAWVEVEGWFSPHEHASMLFKNKFRFLRSLTLGRNQQAIEYIRSHLSFDCLLALLQSKLSFGVKRHICEVLNRAYADCAPNVAVVGNISFIRVNHAFLETKMSEEVADVQWKLKDFLDGCLQDSMLLTCNESDPHSDQYTLEHSRVVYAGNLLSMLRKMFIFGWYKQSEFPRVAEQLLQILSHSRPASDNARSRAREHNFAVALAKREIVKILDVILSNSMNILIDNWLEKRKNDRGSSSSNSNEEEENGNNITRSVHSDFGVVSSKHVPGGKNKHTQDKNHKEMIVLTEASIQHLLLELLLYDQESLEQVSSRLLMRLHNQHNIILDVLQHAVVLETKEEHQLFFTLETYLHTIKDALYYDTWERNHAQITRALQHICALIIEDRKPVTKTQILLSKMGLVSGVIELVTRCFKTLGSSSVVVHECYRVLYAFCFENHANQVLLRDSGIHIMVQHLFASPFVIKCLYLTARTNRLVCDLFTAPILAAIVSFFAQTKNIVCLKLLSMLIQPTPSDKPLRVMQNQICGLLLHPQYNLFNNARELIAFELDYENNNNNSNNNDGENGDNNDSLATKNDNISHFSALSPNSDFDDPLDFFASEQEESPFFQLLTLLSACAEGAYRTAEQRCRDMVSSESILNHLIATTSTVAVTTNASLLSAAAVSTTQKSRSCLSFPIKGSLLAFLDEVYLDSSSSSELFQSEMLPKMCALLESLKEDIAKLVTSENEITEEMKQGTHSQLILYVIDVVVKFVSTLVNVLLEFALLPTVNTVLVQIHDVFLRLTQNQIRMQTILSCPPEGWSEEWTLKSGLGGVRAKNLVRALQGVSVLCKMQTTTSYISALDPALVEINTRALGQEANDPSNVGNGNDRMNMSMSSMSSERSSGGSSSGSSSSSFLVSPMLASQFQQAQAQVFESLVEMFSDSLQLVILGADRHGFHGLKQLAPLLERMGSTLGQKSTKKNAKSAVANLRIGELVLHVFSSSTDVDILSSAQNFAQMHTELSNENETRYRHNTFLWEAVIRLLTRESGLVERDMVVAEEEESKHHLSALYLGNDALADFLRVIYTLLEQSAQKSAHHNHHLQRHLNSMNLVYALMCIVCNCCSKNNSSEGGLVKKERSFEGGNVMLVKALEIATQMLKGRGGTHHHQHVQQSFLESLHTPIGKQFRLELKNRLRAFVKKIDPDAKQIRHTPGEVAVITAIVQFVQLCFEGQSIDLQAFLSTQESSKSGSSSRRQEISLLSETGRAFDSFSFELSRMIKYQNKKWNNRKVKEKLHVIRPRFLNGEDEVSFEMFIELGKAFLTTFIRSCRASYFHNRVVLSACALKGVDRILKALHNPKDIRSSTISNSTSSSGRKLRAASCLELVIYEFWLALLEESHELQKNLIQVFIEVLDVELVFSLLEKSWKKSLETSRLPLKNHFRPTPECQVLFSVLALVSGAEESLKCKEISARFTDWQHEKSHRKLLRNSLVSVEIVRNGLLNRVFFCVPDMFKKNHRAIKDAKTRMLYEVNRSNTEEQLEDFLRLVEGLVTLGRHEQVLRSVPGQWCLKIVRRQEWWRYSLVLCFIINALLTTYTHHTADQHLPHTPYYFTHRGAEIALIILGIALVFTVVLNVIKFSLARGAQMFVTLRKQEKQQRDRETRTTHKKRHFLPLNLKAGFLLLSSPLVVYSFLSIVFGFFGVFWSPFFFSFHLLDSILHFRSLKHIQELITKRLSLIFATIANGGIIVYFFAVLAFVFHLPYEYEHENHTLFHCDTMQNCVQAQFLNGFHKHSPLWEQPNELGPLPFLFDQAMYFLVFVMHTITIGAVIIDSFGEFRESRGEIEEKIHHECFICGIDRDTFNFKGHGFAVHIRREHSMWNYVYLKQYLHEKRAAGYVLGGHEQFLLHKFEARAVDFFPSARALSLETTSL